MRHKLATLAALLCLAALPLLAVAQEGEGGEAAGPQTEKQKRSYSIGVQIGTNFKQQELDVDVDMLMQGLEDAMGEGELRISDDEMQQIMGNLQAEMMARQLERQRALGEQNKKKGDDFLAANKEKEGVVTTESGLQYKILQEGTGATPAATDTVTVHYTGTLIDGTEFDSSVRRGQPAQFPVNGVIKGWGEALQLMKVGGKRMLYIPPDLAYGTRGAPPAIGPNEVLVFEVELLGIDGQEGEEMPMGEEKPMMEGDPESGSGG